MWPTHCEGLLPWPVPRAPRLPPHSLQAAYDVKGHPPSGAPSAGTHRWHILKAALLRLPVHICATCRLFPALHCPKEGGLFTKQRGSAAAWSTRGPHSEQITSSPNGTQPSPVCPSLGVIPYCASVHSILFFYHRYSLFPLTPAFM